MGWRYSTVVVLVLVAAATATVQPTARISLTQETIENVKNAVFPQLMKPLHDLKIDDQDGSESGMDYKLNKVWGQIILPAEQTTVTLDAAKKTVRFDTKGGSGNAKLHFDIKASAWSALSTTGDATVHYDGVSTTLEIQFGVDPAGRATGTVTTTMKSEKMDVNITNSSLAWIFNMIASMAKSTLKAAVESDGAIRLQKRVQEKLNAALSTLPVQVPLGGDDTMTVDVGTVGPAEILMDRVDFFHNGEFYNKNDRKPLPTPYKHHDFPGALALDGDMVVYLDEFTFNSLAGTAFTNKALEAVSFSDAGKLTTDSVGAYVPSLKTKYPSPTPMTVAVTATAAPSVSVKEDGVSFTYEADFNFMVGSEFVFALSGTVGAEKVDVSMNGDMQLVGKVDTLRIDDLQAGRSEIGDLPSTVGDDLQPLMMAVATTAGAPMLNTFMAKGMSLPVIHGTEFVDPTVDTWEGFVVVGGSIVYTMDPEAEMVAPTPATVTAAEVKREGGLVSVLETVASAARQYLRRLV